MKLLCSILAFMLLALSCIPCADAGETNPVPVTASRHSDQEQDAGHSHRDLCSPFCQCSCCSLVYALPQATPPEFSVRMAVPRSPFASYVQQKPSGIAIPVWQPPQLA